MPPRDRLYYEIARQLCQASALERQGEFEKASSIRSRVEAVCAFLQQGSQPQPVPCPDLGEGLRLLCRAEYLRRQGKGVESERARVLAERVLKAS